MEEIRAQTLFISWDVSRGDGQLGKRLLLGLLVKNVLKLN
jgi:hypothetical protein